MWVTLTPPYIENADCPGANITKDFLVLFKDGMILACRRGDFVPAGGTLNADRSRETEQ